jgi:polysaccharide deacetylase family protein (PEP-CTERM system associated)
MNDVLPAADTRVVNAEPRAVNAEARVVDAETRVVNAMTVDVEDWFQVQAFAHCIDRSSWDGRTRRVEANVDRILDLFDTARVKATFFTLGWIAERHPAMVRRIVAAGHELASHGWEHIRADTQDRATFRADVERTRLTLEDIGGTPVVGYRAATFSIGARNQWAFHVLEEAGYAYSSSINPIRHDLYGMPDAPRTPYRPEGGALWEMPMTTVAALGRNWPCAGGGFFRLLPYALYRHGLAAVNQREHMSGIFYFHPWEVDPGQPRVAGCGWKSRVRHYTNLAHMQGKLERVLRDFAWDRMDRVFGDLMLDRLPLPLREAVGGRGSCRVEPLPPTPSLKGRGGQVASA